MLTEEKMSAFVETEAFRRINKASDKAIETINTVLMKKNRGQLSHDDIESTLILLIAKYFKTLVDQHGASGEVIERFEEFLKVLMDIRGQLLLDAEGMEELDEEEEEPLALQVKVEAEKEKTLVFEVR